jgi:hypothetical protein
MDRLSMFPLTPMGMIEIDDDLVLEQRHTAHISNARFA